MYQLRYRDLKTNTPRLFLLLAKSVTDADEKMRRVHEELNNSVLLTHEKLEAPAEPYKDISKLPLQYLKNLV